MRGVVRMLAAGGGLLLGVGSGQAVIAFSNFGPAESFETSAGYLLGQPNEWGGFQFTALASGDVSSIRVAMVQFVNATTASFDLYSNGGGDTVGTLLGTFTGGTPGTTAAVVQLTGGSATLASGSKYWLIARNPLGVGFIWMVNNQGNNLRAAYSDTGGSAYGYSTERAGAFSVEVTPQSVPEPFTMALMGGAALAGYRRVRRSRSSK